MPALTDLEALRYLNRSSYLASPFIQINSVVMETWLNEYAALIPYNHDPDVNYNNTFRNVPLNATGDTPGKQWGSPDLFSQTANYQGDDTVLAFANGILEVVHFGIQLD